MSQWPQVAPSLPECHVSVVLPAAVMLQVTVAPNVAEDNVPSKRHTDTTEAPFPHIDILIVIPVITSAEGTHDAAGGEVPHGQPGGHGCCILHRLQLPPDVLTQWCCELPDVHNQLSDDAAHCLTSVGQLGYACKASMIWLLSNSSSIKRYSR